MGPISPWAHGAHGPIGSWVQRPHPYFLRENDPRRGENPGSIIPRIIPQTCEASGVLTNFLCISSLGVAPKVVLPPNT